MFSFELALLVFGAISFTYAIITKVENSSLYKKVKEMQQKNKELRTRIEKVDFKYAADAMRFLDSLINEKYRYHMYSTLLPMYLDKKIPEKKEINEIKEKIYVSIVGGLTPETKKSILNFFTEKGIEIYIHEKIMVLINATDFKSSNQFDEAFRDLKTSKGIDTLMP